MVCVSRVLTPTLRGIIAFSFSINSILQFCCTWACRYQIGIPQMVKQHSLPMEGWGFVLLVTMPKIFVLQHDGEFLQMPLSMQYEVAATGLIPLSSERVISKFHIQLKTPASPSTAQSNQSFNPGKTLADAHQLEQQKKRIQRLRSRQSISPSSEEQAVNKVIRARRSPCRMLSYYSKRLISSMQ